MSNDITTQAVRLALGMHELQARIASVNIANAGRPEARALQVDFARVQATLTDAARSTGSDPALEARLAAAQRGLAALEPSDGGETIQADQQVGELVETSLGYQALGDALSRHFGLLRLAITGRS